MIHSNGNTRVGRGDYRLLDKVIQKYFDPGKNVIWGKHIFFTRKQLPGETIDPYVTDLPVKLINK